MKFKTIFASLILFFAGAAFGAVQAPSIPNKAFDVREANGIAMRGSCHDRAFISDTQAPRTRPAGKPWTEFWNATACEVTRKFAVMFTPEGARMRISVAPSD
jgi:hypothetical protein